MTWLLLTLVATTLWGITNLIDSDLLERQQQNPNVLTFITGLFGSIPVLLIPLLSIITPSPPIVVAALLGGAVGLFVYWPYYKALEKTHTANVILLWNLAPVFVVFSTWLFLGEQLAVKEYIAIIFLIASSFLTSYQPARSHHISAAAAGWMLLASLATAIEFTLLEYVFRHVSILDGIAWVSVGVLCATITLPLAVPAVRSQITMALKNTRLRKRFALNELLDLTASLLRMGAIRLGSAGLVSAVSGLQPLIVLLFSPLFKSKQAPPSRILMFVAVALGMIGLGLLA